MKFCKICGYNLIKFLEYNHTPQGAQAFIDPKTIPYDLGIPLEIYQCVKCGTVQIPSEPVSYYIQAIRSPGWDFDPFRKKQLEAFINKFHLQEKKIKEIMEIPSPESYDAFLMFNYLEHFPDPKDILFKIYENLDEPGVGIIEVPNFNDIIQERIFAEFIIDHLFYFTKETLQFLCVSSGFDVLEIQEIWEGASLSATVKKREPLLAQPFKENQEKLVQDIETFVKGFRTVAIWGAGHQTLLILTMLNCLDKIPYIVDSFKEKQHTLTPITHLHVVPPSFLEDNPVEGIIVIAGWQYREVLETIKDLKLFPNPTVAVIKKAALLLDD